MLFTSGALIEARSCTDGQCTVPREEDEDAPLEYDEFDADGDVRVPGDVAVEDGEDEPKDHSFDDLSHEEYLDRMAAEFEAAAAAGEDVGGDGVQAASSMSSASKLRLDGGNFQLDLEMEGAAASGDSQGDDEWDEEEDEDEEDSDAGDATKNEALSDEDARLKEVSALCQKLLKPAYKLIRVYKASLGERSREDGEIRMTPATIKEDKKYDKIVDDVLECMKHEPSETVAFDAALTLLDLHQRDTGMAWLYSILDAAVADKREEEMGEDEARVMEDMGRVLARPDVQRLDEAIELLERALRVKLGAEPSHNVWTTWKKRKDMTRKVRNRFLLDGGMAIMGQLRSLYIKTHRHRDAVTAYKIMLWCIDKTNRDGVLRDLVTYASGIGRIKLNVVYSQKMFAAHIGPMMRMQMGVGKSAVDEYIQGKGLLAYSSGAGGHVTNLMRNLLMAVPQPRYHRSSDPPREQNVENAAFAEIAEYCQYNGTRPPTAPDGQLEYVTRDIVLRVLSACIHTQKILPLLIKKGANVHETSDFNWTPLHHFVALGDEPAVRVLLKHGARPRAKLRSGLTAFHLAALYGHEDILVLLAQAARKRNRRAEPTQWKDNYGRTARDVACHLGWAVDTILPALQRSTVIPGQDLPCKKTWVQEHSLELAREQQRQLDEQRAGSVEGDGGWLRPPRLGTEPEAFGRLPLAHPERLVEIRDATDMTVDEFTELYMTLEKPVLLRGAVNPKDRKWRKIFKLLRRRNLDSSLKLRDIPFTRVSIPYAESFGLSGNASDTTLGAFLDYMKDDAPREENPGYIFAVVQGKGRGAQMEALDQPAERKRKKNKKNKKGQDDAHPLAKVLEVPDVLDIAHTNMTLDGKFQFYVGGPRSGAPVHFHGHAYNVCLGGAKHWYLFPPKRAFYSRLHAYDWLKQDYPRLVAEGNAPLELIQQAGDVVIVPEFWGHAVVNLQESVGFASEFFWGSSVVSL